MIGTRPIRIVAQLRLDLAVGIGGGGVLLHQDIGLGGDGLGNIGQTRALLQNGPVLATGSLFPEWHRSGHHQALTERPEI